jgi:hypothetical protein
MEITKGDAFMLEVENFTEEKFTSEFNNFHEFKFFEHVKNLLVKSLKNKVFGTALFRAVLIINSWLDQ